MTRTDCRGLEHSCQSPEVLVLYDQALQQTLRFKGDPLGLAKEALAIDETAIGAHLIMLHAMAFSLHPKFLAKARKNLDVARQIDANEREAMHFSAIDAWLSGHFDQAANRLGQIVERWPTDLLALMFAHQADFFSGVTAPLVTRPQSVLDRTPEDMPGRGFVAGMAAFGFEEAGDFARASDLAVQALEADGDDVWAIHAQAHILEMQGEDEAGIAWYRAQQSVWSQDCVFACHNWWHLALYHIDRLEIAQALAIFDHQVCLDEKSITLNLCDGAALLWRLHLMGEDTDGRFETLADLFARQTPGSHIFNDVHHALTLAGAGRHDELSRLTSELTGLSEADTRYGFMLRQTGMPAIAAMSEFASGRFEQCADHLEALASDEALMTGSLAQREILELTRIEAQKRAGRMNQVRNAIKGKLAAKPHSPKWQREAGRV